MSDPMTNPTPALPESGYVGFWRPNSRSAWHALVQAPSEVEARRLLRHLQSGGDQICLPKGSDPNDR
jgi:hypothetical protein